MGVRTRFLQIFLLLAFFILFSSSHLLEHEGCHERVLLPSAMRGGYEPKGELRHGATVKGPRSWRGAKNQSASRRIYNVRRQVAHHRATQPVLMLSCIREDSNSHGDREMRGV